MSVPRFLVVTADEQTWKFDRPLIFLNDGCRKYNREKIWGELDAIIAKPYPPDKKTIDRDLEIVRELELKLFPKICQILNEFHSTQNSERFWRIVLGHWFHHCVSLLVKRIHTLENVFDSYQISGITTYNLESQDLTAKQYYPHWIFLQGSSQWNNAIYLKILEELDRNCRRSEVLFSPDTETFKTQHLEVDLKGNWKSKVFQLLEKSTYHFHRDTDAFLVSTYLPPAELIKISLKMRQLPQFWKTPVLKLESQKNLDLRRQLTFKLHENSDADTTTTRIIKGLLFDLIPIAYLEGLSEVEVQTLRFNFPKKPKFIFTSNAFLTSDIYKFWIATKAESGTKYFVGQHGNTYLTNRSVVDTVEEVTSDKFLTWGKAIPNPLEYIPAFVFPNKPKKPLVLNPSGGLLLITCTPVGNLDDWDPELGFIEYLEMNQRFLLSLAPEIRTETTLRLHAGYRHLKFNELERWKEFDSNLKIDEGLSPISPLMARHRIIVHGYDSTGILITLSQNVPTQAFWLNGFDHLRDDVIGDYKMLLDVGIIHVNAESAANHINQTWDEIEKWWKLEEVQRARDIFCGRYAINSKNPSRDLSRIFKGIL